VRGGASGQSDGVPTLVTLKDGTRITTAADDDALKVLVAQDGPGQVELPTGAGDVTVRIRQIAAVEAVPAGDDRRG